MIVIECKLGIAYKYPSHLWASYKGSKGPEIRHDDYFAEDYFKGEYGYSDSTYQLYRMVFYANKLANFYKLKPIFISLTNKTWWKIKRHDTSPEDIWKLFCEQCSEKIELLNVFWQDIRIDDEKLQSYINKHLCLQKG